MALKHINGLIMEEEEGVRVSKFHFYYSFLSRRDLDKLVSFSLTISESGKGFPHRILMKEGTLENVRPEGRFTRKKTHTPLFRPFKRTLDLAPPSDRLRKVTDSLIWSILSPRKTWWGRREESLIYPGIFNGKQWKKQVVLLNDWQENKVFEINKYISWNIFFKTTHGINDADS